MNSVWFRAIAKNLTLDDLKQTYSHILSFEADIEQTKENPIFLRPIKSLIHLSYTSDEIIWITKQPIRNKLVLTQDTIKWFDEHDSEQSLNLANSQQITEFLAFIKALFRFDLKQLNENFTLLLSKHFLIAQSKPQGKMSFVDHFKVLFDQNLAIKTMEIKIKDDITKLKFSRMKMVHKKS